MRGHDRSSGFSILELLITLSILVIIAAIATPIYFSYIKKARYSEILKAAESYKTATALCRSAYATSNQAAQIICVNGKSGIPTEFVGDKNRGDRVQSITVSPVEGQPAVSKITIHPFAQGGISASDILTIHVIFDADVHNPQQKVRFDIFGPPCGTKGLISQCSTEPNPSLYP